MTDRKEREEEELLARYQAALLEILGRGGDPLEARAELAARFPALAARIQGFEPRMVELGMHLTATWARRS